MEMMNPWKWKKEPVFSLLLPPWAGIEKTIQWSPVPGKLFAGLFCLAVKHRLELVGMRVYGATVCSYYRCKRCHRTGEIKNGRLTGI